MNRRMFNNIGAGELIIILVILVFFMGGEKLKGLAKGAGEAGRELKRAKGELEETMSELKRGAEVNEEKPVKKKPVRKGV